MDTSTKRNINKYLNISTDIGMNMDTDMKIDEKVNDNE